MANWQTIEELKDIFIRKYTCSELGSELEKACSEEYELKRDYNGRQILELLQNVDDAYIQTSNSSKPEVAVKIVYKEDILEVGNTGTSFSQETMERLCLGRVSDKSSKNIGNKGTGFRSLLNDAEWIEVHSGGFSIKFSEQYTNAQFKKYIDKSSKKFNPLIYKQYEDWKKDYPLHFPIMNCPEQIENNPSEFDTLIRVKVKAENKNKDSGILSQLNQPFYKSLLFLPNITKIEIVTDNDYKRYEKVCDNKRVLLLESQNTLNEYYIEKKKVNILGDKVANLIIAIPLNEDYDFSNEKLYCYFPIRNFKTPVNALFHAPFLTNNSRDDVPNDNEQINKRIFEECLKFLKEITENITKDNQIAIDLPLKTVTPTNNFAGKFWDEDSFNLKSFYLKLLANAKLLPTVNNDYVSISDNPKCFNYSFPQEFKGDLFNNLLTSLPNNVYEFLGKLAEYTKHGDLKYTNKELAEKINQISKNLDISACVKIFLWWNEHFLSSQETPQLLKDTAGNWIQRATKIYLPTDGVSVLPQSLSWVSLCILEQSYVNELIAQLKAKHPEKWNEAKANLTAESISNKRILDKFSDLHFYIQFKEQSNADLIIDDINKQVDTNEKAIAFINWLYKNYKNRMFENSSRYKFDYQLPDRDGHLKTTSSLFFGKEYGKELSEKLFDKSKYFAIANIDTLFKGLKNESEDIINFLKICGVRTYPKVYLNEKLAQNESFVSYIKAKYNYTNNIHYITSMYMDDFEKNLNLLDTNEVLQWITEDTDLYNLILSYEKNGWFSHKSNTYKNPIYSNEYIHFTLNRTKWIKWGNKKYSPQDIVKYPKLKNNIDGILGISERELIKLLGISVTQEMRLAFIDSLAAFPDNVIKQILLKLPEFDKGEISRALYEDIIKLKKDISPTYSTINLKVLAKNGNFYNNVLVRYADRRLPNAKSESIHFIDIPTKRSATTIQNWLGVGRFKINLEFVSCQEKVPLADFDQEMSDLKIAALAMLDEPNKHLAKTRALKVVPCDCIKVKDIVKDNVEFDLDDYNYIKKDEKYYIKLPSITSLEQIRESIDYRTCITEVFAEAISSQIESDKFSYLLLSNERGKKEIIRSQYGVDKWNTIYELLYQSKRINDLIIKFFTGNALSEQKLHSLKDIDFSAELSVEEYEKLRKLLLIIGKDIQDINNYNELIEIDIRPCIKAIFSNYRDSQVEIYRINCYCYALKYGASQKSYLDECRQFRCYDLEINSIKNTIHQKFEETLKCKFSKFDPANFDPSICVDDIYNKHCKTILENSGLTDNELESYLDTYPDIKSRLYFEIPENICEEVKKFSTDESGEEDTTKENLIADFGGYETTTIETMLLPNNSTQENNPQVKSEKSQKQYEKEASNKEKAGKKAEQIAYVELKKTIQISFGILKIQVSPQIKTRGRLI